MLPSSILRNKLDSRNARLMKAVDPDHLIEEAENRMQAREIEATSSQIPSYDRVRPCKLVELGYSPEIRSLKCFNSTLLEKMSEEKTLDIANSKYKEAKQKVVAGQIDEALQLLQEANAACPPQYDSAKQKITELNNNLINYLNN